MSATLVLLMRRPAVRAAAPNIEEGKSRHQFRWPRSNCKRRYQLFPGNRSVAKAFEWAAQPYFFPKGAVQRRAELSCPRATTMTAS